MSLFKKSMRTVVLVTGLLSVLFGEVACGRENMEIYSVVTSDRSKEEVAEKESATETLVVYICGAVRHPGVYEMAAGSRVYQVIEQAGGLKKNADLAQLNQAAPVEDGQMIQILTRKETEEQETKIQTKEDGRIDLNMATEQELMSLPGIGASKAKSILAYRESHGRFSKIEEIMQIEGIKEGVFQKIKDQIRVE